MPKKIKLDAIKDKVKTGELEEEIDEEVKATIEYKRVQKRKTYDGTVLLMMLLMVIVLGTFYFYLGEHTLKSNIVYGILCIVVLGKMLIDWLKLWIQSYKIVNKEVDSVMRRDTLKGMEKIPYDLFSDEEWEKINKVLKGHKKKGIPFLSVVKRSMSKGFLSEGSAKAYLLGDKVNDLIELDSRKILIYLNTLYPTEIDAMLTPKEEQAVQTMIKSIMVVLIIIVSPTFTVGLIFLILLIGSYNLMSSVLVDEYEKNKLDITYEEFESFMDLDISERLDYEFPYTINDAIISYFLYYAKESRGFSDEELIGEIMLYVGGDKESDYKIGDEEGL